MPDVDFQQITRANVYLRDVRAGFLEKQAADRFVYQYDHAYLAAQGTLDISRAMKKQPEPYVERALHPFFDNLIPEGWLLQNTEALLHIDKSNRFAILMATGRFPTGAVTVRAVGPDGHEIDAFSGILGGRLDDGLVKVSLSGPEGFCPTCFKPLEPGAVHRKCVAAMWGTTRKLKVLVDPDRPLTSFAHVIYGGSISGAQKKGAFSLDRGRGILRATPVGAEYILKPDGDFPELPENEHVSMAITRAAGFEVPPFSLVYIPGLGNVYATRRFDITESGTRLMMEDMGQLIRRPSNDKYDSTFERVVAAIRAYSSAPEIDIDDFFRRLVFCFLIANADMHLKNWTLLENERALGTFKLAPCYDMLNTRLPIPRERVETGLKMQGRDRNLKSSYFRQFGRTIGISNPRIEAVFAELPRWLEIIERFVGQSLLKPESKKRYIEIARERFGILIS